MGNYSTVEKRLIKKLEIKKIQEAKRSLNNYVNQLKMHFNLNEEEVAKILHAILIANRNNNLVKKWWQIWK